MRAALACGAVLLAGCAVTPRPPPPADWISHRVCGPDTRPDEGDEYCLEVIEIGTRPVEERGVAMLIPGMYQNGWSWDLMPERGISFARFLVSRGLVVYLLHVRGIGASDLPADSNLDDLVIDDIPRAIAWIAEREGRPIIPMGQSQGSITLKGSLAGLTRCGEENCFDPAVAVERQTRVHAAGFFTGNVALTGRDPRLPAVSCLGVALRGPMTLLLDRIGGRDLGVWGYDNIHTDFWDVLFRPENFSREEGRPLAVRTVDSTTSGITVQFARGIESQSVTSGGTRWVEHLGNIQVRAVQTTFEKDPLSEPFFTWRDDFQRLGSRQKKFKRVRGQAHEDWMIGKQFHGQHWMTVEELITGWE